MPKRSPKCDKKGNENWCVENWKQQVIHFCVKDTSVVKGMGFQKRKKRIMNKIFREAFSNTQGWAKGKIRRLDISLNEYL